MLNRVFNCSPSKIPKIPSQYLLGLLGFWIVEQLKTLNHIGKTILNRVFNCSPSKIPKIPSQYLLGCYYLSVLAV